MSYNLSRVNIFEFSFAIVGSVVLFTFGVIYCCRFILKHWMICKHRRILPADFDTEIDDGSEIEIPRVTFQVDAEPETGLLDSIHVEAYKDNLVIKVPLIKDANVIYLNEENVQPIAFAIQV